LIGRNLLIIISEELREESQMRIIRGEKMVKDIADSFESLEEEEGVGSKLL
jgi:hypothetical protein